MRKASTPALMATCLGIILAGPAAAWMDKYEVFGVEEDDMLKMRSGPGTGFTVIVGLPNKAVVRVMNCERTGATKWCKVALDVAPSLKGYVSEAYIRKY